MSGTDGATSTAEHLAQRFREMGFETQFQEFGNQRRNVIAKTGRENKHLLIGSHYDGQGNGRPSASDNAAGIAVLLEVAGELKSEKLPVSLVITAFDDEEQGLRGSRHYAENPVYSLDQTVAVIIFDTMGRSFIDLPRWSLVVFGTEYSKELAGVVEKKSEAEMLVIGTDLIGPRSDFAPFAQKRLPYLFFTNGTHRDYHGSGDTVGRIQFDRLRRDVARISEIGADIARMDTAPAYREPVYPRGEAEAIIRYMSEVERHHKNLAPAYRLVFGDLRLRLRNDSSRESLRLATSTLLAVATPQYSGFMLSLIGAFYERGQKPEIARAVYEEALKWAPSASARRELEEKLKSLR